MSTLYFILFFTIVSFAIGFKYYRTDDKKKDWIGPTGIISGVTGLMLLYLAVVLYLCYK